MKLSMWTLSGWLERRGFRPTPVISNGMNVLTGPRFLERGVPGSDTVGVIPARNVTGGAGYETALTNDVDLIFIPDADPVEVHNEITRCFESFNLWERDMLMVLVDGGSLQDLLDVAHRVFKQPMFIKGDSSWVFAITPGYDHSVHPDWANLERSAVNRTADFESVTTVSLDPEFQKDLLENPGALVDFEDKKYYFGMGDGCELTYSDGAKVEIKLMDSDSRTEYESTIVLERIAGDQLKVVSVTGQVLGTGAVKEGMIFTWAE